MKRIHFHLKITLYTTYLVYYQLCMFPCLPQLISFAVKFFSIFTCTKKSTHKYDSDFDEIKVLICKMNLVELHSLTVLNCITDNDTFYSTSMLRVLLY